MFDIIHPIYVKSTDGTSYNLYTEETLKKGSTYIMVYGVSEVYRDGKIVLNINGAEYDLYAKIRAQPRWKVVYESKNLINKFHHEITPRQKLFVLDVLEDIPKGTISDEISPL